MKNDLLQACLQGMTAVLNGQAVLLDTMFTAPTGIFCLYAGWWTTEWDLYHPFGNVEGELIQTATEWKIDDEFKNEFTLTTADFADDLLREQVFRMRARQDFERVEYLKQLNTFKTVLDPLYHPDFEQWLEAFNQRPLRNAVEERKKQLERSRRVAILRLLTRSNKVAGVVAMDEDGNAASAGSDFWLEQTADDWRNRVNRDDFELETQGFTNLTYRGACSVSCSGVIQRSGTIESIAAAAIKQ